MKKERQLRRREQVRNTILDAAREIVSKEGIQGLSVRKVTDAIGYSPAIVYHYFRDKNELVETIVREGYSRILESIGSTDEHVSPEQVIREGFTRYIKAALAEPEYYTAIMLDDCPAVLKKTRLLERETSGNSETLQMLCNALKRGMNSGRFKCRNIELTAQIIWTSVFGLIIKLMIEKNTSDEQTDRLIEHYFDIMFDGIMSRGEM